MKAIIWTKYGMAEGLLLKDIAVPVPKENEVLIKIHATTVTAGDSEIRRMKVAPLLRLPLRLYFGLFKPRNIILGQELAGEIIDIGNKVTKFKKGDQVFGTTGMPLGGYAEYACLRELSGENALVSKPINMSYEQAATIPVGGLEALYFLNKSHIKKGQRVLVIGGGGSIGSMAIQLAKYYGAIVTGIDHTQKLNSMIDTGADYVFDYTKDDGKENSETYDVIYDVIGKSVFSDSLKMLKEESYYLIGNPGFKKRILGFITSKTSRKKVCFGTAAHRNSDLLFLKDLIEKGVIKAVIDKRYKLEQIVEAHKYVDSGQKKGNVSINLVSEDSE